MKKIILLILLQYVFCACGVKGPPRPPIRPVELGRGQPHFRGATKDMAYENIPPLESEQDDEEGAKKQKPVNKK